MASRPASPRAEIIGIYGGFLKMMTCKMFGQVPEAVGVMWHYTAVFKDSMGFGRKVEKWLDPNLAAFAHMAAASLIGCRFCLDLNYFMARNRGS
jgi:hypothetical protein